MSEIIRIAARFARDAHGKQTRKYSGAPYFGHLANVATLVKVVAGAPDWVVAAAYLHDTVEDTKVTYEDLREAFGRRIANLVSEVTDVSRPENGNRAERKALDLNHLSGASEFGQTIKLADLIDNSRDIVRNDPKFAKVYIEEKKALLMVLTRGDRLLFHVADEIVGQASRELGLYKAAA